MKFLLRTLLRSCSAQLTPLRSISLRFILNYPPIHVSVFSHENFQSKFWCHFLFPASVLWKVFVRYSGSTNFCNMFTSHSCTQKDWDELYPRSDMSRMQMATAAAVTPRCWSLHRDSDLLSVRPTYPSVHVCRSSCCYSSRSASLHVFHDFSLTSVKRQKVRHIPPLHQYIIKWCLDTGRALHLHLICSIPGGGWEFFSSSRPALGPIQPPVQWVPGALSLGVKRPGHEADHSPPSSAEVKNAWSYTSTLPIRIHGVVLS
jgi:hypothetical protein